MNVNAKRDNSRIKEIEIMDCTLRDGVRTLAYFHISISILP